MLRVPCRVQKDVGRLERVQSRSVTVLKELESMTYEEAGEEFTVFSLSLLEKKNPHKNKHRDGREDLTSSQWETVIKKAGKI